MKDNNSILYKKVIRLIVKRGRSRDQFIEETVFVPIDESLSSQEIIASRKVLNRRKQKKAFKALEVN